MNRSFRHVAHAAALAAAVVAAFPAAAAAECDGPACGPMDAAEAGSPGVAIATILALVIVATVIAIAEGRRR
jgi:hypothetical protein